LNNWSFGTRINTHQRRHDASPHTNYLFEFLKSVPGRQRSRERLRSIAQIQGPSMHGKSRNSRFTWKGAQYSRGLRGVNRWPRSLSGARFVPRRATPPQPRVLPRRATPSRRHSTLTRPFGRHMATTCRQGWSAVTWRPRSDEASRP
jgi:hypothetical protein